MKKTFTSVIALIFISIGVNAQETFTTYDNVYAKKSFDILLTSNKDKFTLYIDAMSLDKLHEKGGFMIDNKKHQSFIDALNQAKAKYKEWVKTAKENNVKELNKEIKVKSTAGGYFYYGKDWHYQFLIDLTFDFRILEEADGIEYLLIVRSGKMKSSSNQFMEVDGVVLVFSSENEIEEFINAISIDKINEFKNKPKPEDLFKD